MKFIYEDRPWLKSYPQEVPAEIEVPLKSVGDAFDDATEKWKDETAIIFYGKKISYKKLREQTDRFANALTHLGIKKGDRVALLLLNSPEYIIAFYAVGKVGGIVTPISPVYVSIEIKYQLINSGSETIICNDILYDGVENTGVKLKNVILVNVNESLPWSKKFVGESVLREVYQKRRAPSQDISTREGFFKFHDLIKKYPPDSPKVEINPKEDLILLPYTGGTTGLPKGVMITHYNVIACDTQYNAFYPHLRKSRQVVVAYMPFYHAIGKSVTVVNGILSGSILVIISNPDIDRILNATTNHKATIFLGTPAMFEILKDHKNTGKVNWKNMKIILSGGDALHEITAKDWEIRTGVRIHEAYGMTETTSMNHGNPLGKAKTGSIGVPTVGTRAAIIDPEKDEFVPLGEMGELAVQGSNVTKGYWNDPKATRECEGIINGVRWWRTGDLAFMKEDGYFYIYDRKRDLIKYKGLRVYAREVEEILKTHPKIKEVGVVGVKDIKVGENVKVSVVLEPDARGNLSEADIIEYCKGKLAHYKIPRIVEFVGEIPKTDVGKVSRRELREEEI